MFKINKKTREKIGLWCAILLFLLIFIVPPFNIAALNNAGIFLFFITALMLLSFLFLFYDGLDRLINKFKGISLNGLFVYAAVVFLILITLFTYLYILLINQGWGELCYASYPCYEHSLEINDPKSFYEVLYFSGATFFSQVSGDIVPEGYARAIFLVETYVGLFSFMVLIGLGLYKIQDKFK